MLAKTCFKSYKSQSFTLMKKFTKNKYQIQNLIRKKKREFYKTNLRQKINKRKELWKTLKSINHLFNEILFNATKNCFIFKNYFSSFAHNLVSKLPLSPNVFTESKIASYYENNAVSKNLNFQLHRRLLKKY